MRLAGWHEADAQFNCYRSPDQEAPGFWPDDYISLPALGVFSNFVSSCREGFTVLQDRSDVPEGDSFIREVLDAGNVLLKIN